ncbi:SynChlorMet cassette protein ScmC, partial [candidate division WOR-3 bacterium]|nr:SynChlorMet cassette protein ScmC [candidate division WOR-3 bacterium]
MADGQRWVIQGNDAEAESTVRELGQVMQLSPAGGGRELRVMSGRRPPGSRRGTARAGLTVLLGGSQGWQNQTFRMERVANAIAVEALTRNGLLLHGALAVRNGIGVVLCGTSGVGKSTASQRLPSPWRSLSDDCTLVVRGSEGRYYAHPWPTWSLLRDNGLVKSWPVERAAPIQAMMFLAQSPSDRAELISETPGTALIMESALQLARAVAFTPDGEVNRKTCVQYLHAARGLAAAVPAFRLHLSLTGRLG